MNDHKFTVGQEVVAKSKRLPGGKATTTITAVRSKQFMVTNCTLTDEQKKLNWYEVKALPAFLISENSFQLLQNQLNTYLQVNLSMK